MWSRLKLPTRPARSNGIGRTLTPLILVRIQLPQPYTSGELLKLDFDRRLMLRWYRCKPLNPGLSLHFADYFYYEAVLTVFSQVNDSKAAFTEGGSLESGRSDRLGMAHIRFLAPRQSRTMGWQFRSLWGQRSPSISSRQEAEKLR